LLLLCFPYAGGGPSVFHGWAELLPAEVELLAVHLPGRHTRIGEQPYHDWHELLLQLEKTVGAAVDRPLVLFGHSLGAMMAYELTRRLVGGAEDGVRNRTEILPHRLLLAGCRAPDVPLMLPAIHHLPDEEFTRHLPPVVDIPPEVLADHRMMQLMRPLLRSDLTLAETWPPVAATSVSIPATLFAGRDDLVAPPWSMRRWCRFVGPLTIHVLDGDHFSFQSANSAFVKLLTAELAAIVKILG
jgi:surfactin synthase thioesterase subunit